MLNRLFSPKKQHGRGDALGETIYRAGRRIKEVQMPYLEKQIARLKQRIAEKRTDDGQ